MLRLLFEFKFWVKLIFGQPHVQLLLGVPEMQHYFFGSQNLGKVRKLG